MRLVNKIIIHCTATEDGKDIRAKDIKAYHVNVKGWRNIGYHYVIDLDGTIEPGRPISQPGAHCLGQNAHSIGVAYVGGLKNGKPADTRTPAQKAALLKLVTKLVTLYRCEVHGHCEYAKKACPCFDVQAEYGKIKSQVQKKWMDMV